MNYQMNWAKEPTLAVEQVVDDLVHGVTPTTNVDNLSTRRR